MVLDNILIAKRYITLQLNYYESTKNFKWKIITKYFVIRIMLGNNNEMHLIT